MRNALGRRQVIPLTATGTDVASSGSGRILMAVFETLDRAAIPYCVLHGYEGYPERIESDVDGIISAQFDPVQLLTLLHNNSARIGADVVWSRGCHFVLASKNADGSPCFLEIDFNSDYELDDRLFYAGWEVLESRRRHHLFWIPNVGVEFSSYLFKKITKGRLDDAQARRLSNLFRQDPAGCERQVARFLGPRSTTLALTAAGSGDWEPVRHSLGKLRAELRRRAILRSPGRVVGSKLRRLAGRIRRFWRPDGGLDIVFLGPDGAGKSSVIEAVRQGLAGAFARTTCQSFPPGILDRLLHRPDGPNILPHARPPRSFVMSSARAVLYWFVYYRVCYVITVRLALACSALVLHDRHLVDALVDPKRYRYGGPMWLLHLIWRLIPKPDLIILLDAPPGVLQARKQEVPFDETVRQRDAYLSLIRTMGNGRVVDAGRPLALVIEDVNEIILRHLATRGAGRLGLERHCAPQPHPARFDAPLRS